MAKKKMTQEQIELLQQARVQAAEFYPRYQWDIGDAGSYMGFIKGAEWLISKMK